jgi:hypothetical protein
LKIDRRLFLVQSIETESGIIHIHSMPVSLEVWRNYFLILAKTYSQIFAQGLHSIAGPSVACLMLERLARIDGVWEGESGVQQGLLNEIRRLTNIVLPTGKGWETVPYEVALSRQLIDPEDIEQIEGAIVFFICASAVLRGRNQRTKLEAILMMIDHLWGARSSSLDVMAFAASLPISIPAETIGVSPTASLLPH